MNSEKKAQEIVSVILKTLQREDDPITSLLEIYIKAELESYHKNNLPKAPDHGLR